MSYTRQLLSESEQRLAHTIRAAQLNQSSEDGWIVTQSGGHTPETYDRTQVRSGRETAVGYLLNRLSGTSSDHEDLRMIERLLSLVNDDPASRTFGCMRWYAEESAVSDTNAAFFSVFPLVVLEIARPELIPMDHLRLIRTLLARTTPWFAAECSEPRLYYPNKIISDGSMLLGIGTLLEDDAVTTQALSFLREWNSYTDDRGWGWGENISLGYQRVILIALRLAIRAATPVDAVLAADLSRHEEAILAEAAFHDGAEFVPTIRSYNFSGSAYKGSLCYALIGHPDNDFQALAKQSGQAWAKAIALLLFADELSGRQYAAPAVPRGRSCRVFDRSTAVTWIGDGIRLGSVSRFPVMPDHYQQSGWGLGWQSFPVSALVGSVGVSKLLWYAKSGDTETTHPYYGDDGLHRNYVLAGKRPYPAVVTHAAQRDGTAIVVRSISRIHDHAIDVADQWLFKRGRGSVTERDGWYLQLTADTALAVRPLYAFRSGCSKLEPPKPVVVEAGDDLAVRVALHNAEDGALASDRLEVAWIIAARDHVAGEDELIASLAELRVRDEARYPFTVPRMDYAYVREITLSGSTAQLAKPLSLSVDYHRDLWR